MHSAVKCILIFLFAWNTGQAQTFARNEANSGAEEAAERYAEVSEQSDLSELLPVYQGPVLNLNTAGISELAALPGLTPAMAMAIAGHRKTYGPFLSLYELQTIEGFHGQLIRSLLPYVRLDGSVTVPAENSQMLRIAAAYRPEKPEGYSGNDPYRGSPLKTSLRYRGVHSSGLRWGIQAEKDDGEELKFLFLSAYAEYKGKGRLRQLLLGDQQFSFAQGLMLGSGLGGGKSAQIMQIMRHSHGGKPYGSFNETGFVRGISMQIEAARGLQLYAYSGQRRLDANIRNDLAGGLRYGVLHTAGNYRNEKEIALRHQIRQNLHGFHLLYQSRSLELEGGLMHSGSNLAFSPDGSRSELKYGGSWKWQHRNFLGFGEVVSGNRKPPSFLTGLLAALGKRTDMAILLRHYAPDYEGQLSNAFGDKALNRNETGLYSGLSFGLPGGFSLGMYNDVSRSRAAEAGFNGPALQTEQFCELRYSQRNSFGFALRYTCKSKESNAVGDGPVRVLETRRRESLRLHLDYHSGRIQFRNRLEQRFSAKQNEKPKQGFLFYHDARLQLHPSLDLSCRLSIFGAEDYDARGFSFENEIPGTYSIRSFSGHGIRYYLLFHWKMNQDLQIWFRFARTSYDDRESPGSGTDTIASGHVSDLQIQIQWKL